MVEDSDVVPANPAGPVLYAFTLGLVAALNPCGFPMLPAYLAVFTGTAGASAPMAGSRAAQITRGLLAGACISAGFVAVFGVLGLLLEGGARLATGWLPWLMAAVGVVMAGAGISTLLGRAPALHLVTSRFRTRRSVLAMAAYGVAYAAGSVSCSLPLFLAAVAGSFTGQSIMAGLTTYLAYALGMALFVTAAAVVTSTLGGAAVRRVRAVGRLLPAASGIILALSGAYLAYYWTTELLEPAGVSPLTSMLTAAEGWLTAGIAAHPLLSAALLGTVVLAAIAVVIHRTLTEAPDTRPGSGKGSTTP
jgi:cytochrome c biogenesis protein CcdA